jgi:hypothetical protein
VRRLAWLTERLAQIHHAKDQIVDAVQLCEISGKVDAVGSLNYQAKRCGGVDRSQMRGLIGDDVIRRAAAADAPGTCPRRDNASGLITRLESLPLGLVGLVPTVLGELVTVSPCLAP